MDKLKDLLKEGIGGFVSQKPFMEMETGSDTNLLQLAQQIVGKNQEKSMMTKEELNSSVSNYNSYGKAIHSEHNIAEIAKTFTKIAEAAQKHVVEETAEWFDKVTVQRNMTDLKKHASQFNKIATEAKAMQDRMSALYEDMGGILNRYYEIKEIKED